MIETPHPELEELLTMMGAAGRHMAEIEACEGAAGNISVCMRWPVEPHALFPIVSEVELSKPVPELAGATFLVSGSGRRLREIIDDPTANVACIVVNEGGKTGQLHTSPASPLRACDQRIQFAPGRAFRSVKRDRTPTFTRSSMSSRST